MGAFQNLFLRPHLALSSLERAIGNDFEMHPFLKVFMAIKCFLYSLFRIIIIIYSQYTYMDKVTNPQKLNRKPLWLGLFAFMLIGSAMGVYYFTPKTAQYAKPAEPAEPALTKALATQKNTGADESKGYVIPQTNNAQAVLIDKEAHNNFINAHPYNTREKRTKKEMKAMGIAKKDRPDLAAEQEFFKTLDPATQTIPKLALQKAREDAKAKLKKTKAAIAGVSWTERGPNNVAGRTHALMFDPNDVTRKKVWAGAVAGGLWYNNDITSSISTWQKVDDFWANMAISTITSDPTNNQVFYVGTAEGFTQDSRGAGIWKTTNGGTTWNQLASTTPAASSNFTYINKIIVHSTGQVFAATSSGVRRSTDGGLTWSAIYNTNTADMDLATNGDIYIGTFGGVVARTTNPTATTPTWTNFNPSTGGNRVELAIAPSASSVTASTTVYAIASNGSDIAWFRKTTDGGATWTSVIVPQYLEQTCSFGTTDFTRGQSWYDLVLKVRPDNANIVLVGGIDIYGTTNGGTSWSLLSYWTGGCSKQYLHADQHAIEFRSTNLNETIFGNDGGVSYSTNAGTGSSTGVSISERNNGYNVTQFYACAMNNTAASNVYIAGSQDNGTNRFANAGVNSTTEVKGGDGGFCFIDQTNPNIAIASYVYNNFSRSTNGGVSFTSDLMAENTGSFINPADYDYTANILYTAGNAGQLKRVSNVETSPSTLSTLSLSIANNQISTIKANCFTANRIFIGTTAGNVYRLDNANATPTVTSIGSTLPAGYVSCVDVGATDNELIVTLSSYDVISVHYSNNGGTSWISKDNVAHGLPNMPIRWALFNPNNTKEVMLATELGVWSTSDITASNPGWEASNNSLANVRCDMLRYRTADKQVAIATFGRGLYTTNVFANSSPTANFTYTPRQIVYQPTAMVFTDASAGTITSRLWNFGSGASTASATTVGPHNITYNTLGVKTITLAVNGTNTSTQNVAILPTLTPTYMPTDGGDFETSIGHYISTSNASGLFFERGNSAITGKNGTGGGANAYVTGLALAQYADNSEAMLYTPNFNFSTAGTYTISFKTKFSTEANYDGFLLQSSIDQGATWANVGTAITTGWYNSTTSATNNSFATGTAFFSGVSTGFEVKTFNASALAGNTNVAFRFVFRSDDGVQGAGVAIDDFQINAPFVHTTLLPAHTATGVSTTADLAITFNSAVSKGTGNILVKRVSDNVVLETINVVNTSVTTAGNLATINPTLDLPSGIAVYVEIAAGAFKNILNTNHAGFTGNTTWQFTTGDAAPPTVVSFLPTHNSAGAAVASNLVINFNEAVQKGTGDVVIKRSIDNTVFENIAITNANVTVAGSVVTINPTTDFASTTQYYVEMGNSAIKDMSNNNFAGFSGTGTWQFTTVDAIAPTLVSLLPANNTINVDLTNNLTLTFNESVQKGTGNIVIKRNSDNSVFETIAITNATVTVVGAVITVNPVADFAGNTQYYVEVANGAIKDMANNNFVGFTGNSTWLFTTPDNVAPTLVSFLPTNGAANVAVANNFTITFNENVQKGSGNIVIKRSSDNSVFETIAITNANVTVAGSAIAINPISDLASSTQYYIEVASGAIQDVSGNNYAGFTGVGTWQFTSADALAPVIVSLLPAHNATAVALNANLVITFNESVQKGAGNIVLKRTSNNSVFETIAITNANVTVAGSAITINPATDFDSNTGYYVEIGSGAIKDLANNDYTGFTGNGTWQFTSIDNVAPTLTSLLPAHNSINFTVANNLVITLNENTQKGIGNIVIKRSQDNTVFETIDVASGQVSITTNAITINPTNNLLTDTQYYVEIANGALKDLAGNNYAGFTGNSTWQFVTLETVPPALVSLTPINGTTNASPTTNLVMTFNENIQKGAGNIIIKRSSDNVAVETINISNPIANVVGGILTINPANDLLSGLQYYIEVSNGAIQDAVGNNYAGFTGNTTWQFNVIDNTAPTLVSLSPNNNATNILIGVNLVMTFNEAMQKGNTGAIVIKKVSNNAIAESIDIASANITISGATVTINPTANLELGVLYYVDVPNSVVKDLAGNSYTGFLTNTEWRFTTQAPLDNTAPLLISTTPPHNFASFAGANNLEMNFNENIQKGSTGSIVIRRFSDNTTVELFGINSSRVSIAGTIVTINPINDLPFNTDLYVEVSNDYFKDLAGNNFAGFTGSGTWKFKTDFSTAIEDAQLSNAIRLYPNPVAKQATLAVEKGLSLKNVQLKVIDAQGIIVWTREINQLSEIQNLDLSTLPTGKYHLQINTGKAIALKPFVKVD